ncbi:unnamed protein product [Durusdinium trenchii]|uniref:IQ motif and ankyrin repeat domain-containing protein n=2 Tax=Durusdinium trenchii TaxID=1381693 RepID=A0ABP0SCS1_9DINO
MAGSGLFNRVAIPGPFEEKPVREWAGWQEADAKKDNDKVIHQTQVEAPPDVPRIASPNQPDTAGRLLGHERRVSILSVEVAGARMSACNGIFRYDGLHQQKPLFKADSGAIIYFNRFWKMNAVFKTSSWMYSHESKESLPPEGDWTLQGSLESSTGGVPVVKLLDEPYKSLGPQGASLRLQGGRTVLKREENKSWRWIEVPIYSDIEAEEPVESLEALCARLAQEEAEEQELNFGLFASVHDEPAPSASRAPDGYYSFDMIRQMGQELMSQTPASNAGAAKGDSQKELGPPWPLETPGLSLGERLRRSSVESRRGDSGNLLRARLHFG